MYGTMRLACVMLVACTSVHSQTDSQLMSCQRCKQEQQTNLDVHRMCLMCDGGTEMQKKQLAQHSVNDKHGNQKEMYYYDCIPKPTNGLSVVTGSGTTDCSTMYCLKNTSTPKSGECSCHKCAFKKAVSSSMHLNVSVNYSRALENNATMRAEFIWRVRSQIAKALNESVKNVEIQDIVLAGRDFMISRGADSNSDNYVTVAEYNAWREEQTGKLLTNVQIQAFKAAANGSGRFAAKDFEKFITEQLERAAVRKFTKKTKTSATLSTINVSTGIKCVAGHDVYIGVTAMDADDQINTDGGDSFFLVAFGPGNPIEPVDYVDLHHGNYVAKFVPTQIGKYTLRTSLRTGVKSFARVGNSVALKVTPGSFSAEKTTLEHGVRAPGAVSVYGHYSYFDIVPRDKYNNEIMKNACHDKRGSNDDCEIGIKWLSSRGKDSSPNKNHERISSKRRDGTYRVGFKETMKTSYEVEVQVGKKYLPKPFKITAMTKTASKTRHASLSAPPPPPMMVDETSAAPRSSVCVALLTVVTVMVAQFM